MKDNFSIRKYEPPDREIVRQLCCDTGFLGNPIDPVFADRELFADFLTSYYTDAEPESSFVIEVEGEVSGYLLGSRKSSAQSGFFLRSFPKLLWKLFCHLPKYDRASREYLWWLARRGSKETPPAPKGMPHFHINLLPVARKVATTAALMNAFLRYLAEAGETHVYGQMVTFDERRTQKMFERYGFKVMNRSEITKYRKVHPEPVFLTTVVKDLRENVELYGEYR